MSLAANIPSYLGGDFNGNGSVDASDYAVWRDSLGAISEVTLNNNGDGMNGVDIGDYNLWRRNFGITVTQTGGSADLSGDFNGDGVVDSADYVVWRVNVGELSESSLNYSGDGLNGVDVGDYLLWRQNFGRSSTAANGSSGPVPEPSNVLLILFWLSVVWLVARPRLLGRNKSN
jgi:hypothetical protein